MASKSYGTGSEWSWARAPPVPRPLWQRCAYAFYDPDEKSFLGRTPKRWGIVLAFYGVFYAVLALFFAICMGGLFLLLNDKRPMYTLSSSLIGSNPGMGYRPYPDLKSGLIQYDVTNKTQYESIISDLDEFFKSYDNEPWYLLKKECISSDNYGYPTTPCFFIKVNKLFDWIPHCYTAKDLPSDMPKDLKDYILKLDSNKTAETEQIWISCEAEGDNSTVIEYPWDSRGLPMSAYPYTNAEGYKTPLIAIRLHPLVNTLTTIRCRAWAKNIIYRKSLREGTGYARLQLSLLEPIYNSTAVEE